MSTDNLVIVRAHENEPVKLLASKISVDRVVVTNTLKSSSLSLPKEKVYQFDAVLFDRLRTLFDTGGTSNELEMLWNEAKNVEQ